MERYDEEKFDKESTLAVIASVADVTIYPLFHNMNDWIIPFVICECSYSINFTIYFVASYVVNTRVFQLMFSVVLVKLYSIILLAVNLWWHFLIWLKYYEGLMSKYAAENLLLTKFYNCIIYLLLLLARCFIAMDVILQF